MDEVRGSIPLGSTDRMNRKLAFLASTAFALGACEHHSASQPEQAVDAQALVVPNDWPPLPKAPGDVGNVVRDRANRPPVAPSRPTWEEIKKHLGGEKVIAGDDVIASALDGWVALGDSPSFVLFGSLHDSGAQVDELRRLTTRMPHLWGVVMEQFKSRGAWPKADVAAADTDDADLAEFFATGSDAALYRLRVAQVDHDYAAWKFDYVPAVLDAVVALRGVQKPVFACDMPKSLIDPSLEGTDEGNTLREAHCAISAREKLRTLGPAHVAKGETYVDDVPPPMRAAFFVGDNHAGIGGLARFLHEGGRIATVHMMGGRPDPELPADMTVVDPVLVPVGDGRTTEWALILPNASGAMIDRVIDKSPPRTRPAADGTISAPTVWIESDGPVKVSLSGAEIAVGTTGEWLRVRPGTHACTVARPAGGTLTFALQVTASGFTSVRIDSSSPGGGTTVRVSDSP